MPLTDELSALRARHAAGWPWIMAYGLLLGVIGVLALLRPIVAGIATGLFLGLILIAGGVLGIVAGFARRGWHSRWIDIVVGVLSVMLGLAFLRFPFAGAFSLIWLIAVWAITIGALELIAAVRLQFGRGWLIALGALNLLLGVMLLMGGPVTGLVFLALVVGVSFLMRGGLLIALAWHLRGAR